MSDREKFLEHISNIVRAATEIETRMDELGGCEIEINMGIIGSELLHAVNCWDNSGAPMQPDTKKSH